jgi:hypothetical protein
MSCTIIFDSPTHRTLFIIEADELRIVTFDGEEALLVVGDFIAFLLHVSFGQVPAFTRFAPDLRRRIAASLEQDPPHGKD